MPCDCQKRQPVQPAGADRKTHCLMHDAASVEARREAARKGGRNRSAMARAKAAIPEALTAAELAGWLSALFTSTIAGKTEPRVATAAATVAKTLLEARSVGEFEQRLADLEARAGVAEQWSA